MSVNSSNSGTAKTLAEPELIRGLVELANLRDDPAAFERFCTRCPGLAYVSGELPDPHPIVHTTLPTKFWLVWERREKLRALWEGELHYLREFLLPADPPEELRVTGTYIDRNSADIQIGLEWDAPIDLDWAKGSVVYVPRTEFQRAVYALLRKSSLAKMCGNPDCPDPYFVAKRAGQRYCRDKCAELFQKEWKREWWAKHGNAWRRGRKKTKRQPAGKG
jgi:hypothetical protein